MSVSPGNMSFSQGQIHALEHTFQTYCRARVYPNLDQALADKLFDKWGGRPRYTLVRFVARSYEFPVCPSPSPSPKEFFPNLLGLESYTMVELFFGGVLQEKAMDPSAQALLDQAFGSDLLAIVQTLGRPGRAEDVSDRQVFIFPSLSGGSQLLP